MIKKTLKINGVERILILDKDETLAQVLSLSIFFLQDVRSVVEKVIAEHVMLL